MGKLGVSALGGPLLLASCLALGAGCSTTGGSRFRTADGSRSMASVGDQALPPTVGASGAQVEADAPEPQPYRNPRARISGRVVDPKGRAVAGATVRLADGASKVGRDVQTTTDPSGAFTLGGLRPGSGYLLIAEANFGDDRPTMTGRVQADTADTRVVIQLGTSGDDPAPVATAKRPRGGSPRSQAVSDRTDRGTPADGAGVNDEDLGPPVEPADQAAPGTRRRPGGAGSSSAKSGWHRPGADPDPDATSPADDAVSPTEAKVAEGGPDADPGVGSSPKASRSSRADEAEEADPLPPSLPAPARGADDPPAPAPARRARSRPLARIVPEAPDEAESAPPGQLMLSEPPPDPDSASAGGGLKPMPTLASLGQPAGPAPTAEAPGVEPAGPGGPPDLPPPDALALGDATPVVAPSPSPAVPGDVVSAEPQPAPAIPAVAPVPAGPPGAYNPFALVAALPPEPARPTTGPVAARPDATTPPTPPDTATAGPAGDAAPRAKKWGEIAVGTGGATAGDLAKRTTATRAAQSTARPGTLMARRSKPTAPAVVDAPPMSDFDSRANQLVDFQLPGLDGQPVHFRDLDADLILLDFWGTWCNPCVDSIPHLIDLQKKYGPDKLKVVGIACEDLPPAKRRAAVAAAAEKLGINYSVLLSSRSGDCPVQRDFRVQFYPTMILLNRSGKVLHKVQGATENTLHRLDNAIESASQAKLTARR